MSLRIAAIEDERGKELAPEGVRIGGAAAPVEPRAAAYG